MKRLLKKEKEMMNLFGEGACEIGAIYCFDNVSSTMDVAFELDETMVKDRTIVIAESQTHGRGRFDRTWYSGSGSIILSIILLQFDFRIPYSMLAAFAVYRTFRRLTERVRLKWVNDVLWENGKKVCGILTEERNGRTVIGIGVNLNNRSFPPSIVEYATSYYLETGRQVNLKVFTSRIIMELFDIFKRQRMEGVESVMREWEIESRMLNRTVRVVTTAGEFLGVVRGINRQTGALELLTEKGLREIYDGTLFYLE